MRTGRKIGAARCLRGRGPRRLVKCLGQGPFTLKSLVDAAARYGGTVLVGIDAPLGAPRSLLAVTHKDMGLAPTATFVDWLTRVAAWPNFFSRAVEGEPWEPLRPFFRVAPGADARNQWFRAMRDRGVEPLREVDTVTAAKSLFILAGIPGSVGSSVVDLWPALPGLLASRVDGIRCWPFDQVQPDTGAAGVVLAEIYPRALYAAALAPEPPPFRARLSIAKADPRCRRAATESLLAQDWVRQKSEIRGRRTRHHQRGFIRCPAQRGRHFSAASSKARRSVGREAMPSKGESWPSIASTCRCPSVRSAGRPTSDRRRPGAP